MSEQFQKSIGADIFEVLSFNCALSGLQPLSVFEAELNLLAFI